MFLYLSVILFTGEGVCMVGVYVAGGWGGHACRGGGHVW